MPSCLVVIISQGSNGAITEWEVGKVEVRKANRPGSEIVCGCREHTAKRFLERGIVFEELCKTLFIVPIQLGCPGFK